MKTGSKDLIRLTDEGLDGGLGKELMRTAQLKGYKNIEDYYMSPFRVIYSLVYSEDFVLSAFNAACSSGNLVIVEKLLDVISQTENEWIEKTYSHGFWFYPHNLHLFKFFLEKKFITEKSYLPVTNFKKEGSQDLLDIVCSFYNQPRESAIDFFLNSGLSIFASLIHQLDLSKLSLKSLKVFYKHFEIENDEETCKKIVAFAPSLNRTFTKTFKSSSDGVNWEALEKTLFELTVKDIKKYTKEYPNQVCCNFSLYVAAHHSSVEAIIVTFQELSKLIAGGSRAYLGDILKKFHSIGEYKKNATPRDRPEILLQLLEDKRREPADYDPINYSSQESSKWLVFADALENAMLIKNGEYAEQVSERLFESCCHVVIRLVQEGAFNCLQRDSDFEIHVFEEGRSRKIDI